MSFILLALCNLLFFWRFYTQPYTMATSELLSTFFPTWIWQGREWVKGRIPKYDESYWGNAHALPVLSTYYPIHMLSAMLGSFFRLDTAFKIFIYTILSHYIFASIGYFLLFKAYFPVYVALFGAIAFTYLPYHWKQQPSIVYTLSWFPWIFKLKGIAIGMMLLAGYYPLVIYLLPMSLVLNHEPLQWVFGFFIGSIQLVPFLLHLPKTIKGKIEAPSEPGPWETNFYIGIVPIVLLLTHLQWRYLWLGVPIIGSHLLKDYLPRIYQRAWLLSAYVALYFVLPLLQEKTVLLFLFLHITDLWLHTRNLPFYKPYAELWQKPSRAFNTRLTRFLEANLKGKISGLPWPLFTGYINKLKTIGYCGSMQTQEMYAWRKSFKHDPFIDGVDEDELTKRHIAFAYSRKKLNQWLPTPIRHLYRNPEYNSVC